MRVRTPTTLFSTSGKASFVWRLQQERRLSQRFRLVKMICITRSVNRLLWHSSGTTHAFNRRLQILKAPNFGLCRSFSCQGSKSHQHWLSESASLVFHLGSCLEFIRCTLLRESQSKCHTSRIPRPKTSQSIPRSIAQRWRNCTMITKRDTTKTFFLPTFAQRTFLS